MHDEKLPENIHGLLLGGGYPELYAKQLEENESMRKSIKEALEQQLPSLAECGGFMYLHDTLTDRGNNLSNGRRDPGRVSVHGKTGTVWLCGGTAAARTHGEGNSGKTGTGKNKGA